MTKPTASAQFRAAIKQRKAHYPFDCISAHKVRESRDNLQHNLKTVGSIAGYLRARPCDRRSSMLVGCTQEDKAYRLKGVPEIIAREFGYNLIPAIEALTLHGVPEAEIVEFVISIKPQVDHLLADCNAVQMSTARSIKGEYGALKSGASSTEWICAEALRIADLAVAFCEDHGV
ncbi:MAG: hypothetical protein RLZZ84_184 [Pseudomonadota bacterium]|jgi:hypothetical protein